MGALPERKEKEEEMRGCNKRDPLSIQAVFDRECGSEQIQKNQQKKC